MACRLVINNLFLIGGVDLYIYCYPTKNAKMLKLGPAPLYGQTKLFEKQMWLSMKKKQLGSTVSMQKEYNWNGPSTISGGPNSSYYYLKTWKMTSKLGKLKLKMTSHWRRPQTIAIILIHKIYYNIITENIINHSSYFPQISDSNWEGQTKIVNCLIWRQPQNIKNRIS